MDTIENPWRPLSPEQIDTYTERLDEVLPDIASDLIRRHLNMFDEDNASFALHPDDPAEHSPRWHELGIISHSREYARYIRLEDGSEAAELLQRWGEYDAVQEQLAETIDGVPISSLMRVAATLHDLGKFTKRLVSHDERGEKRPTFLDHEKESGRIIREELWDDLHAEGLTRDQIEYIAGCAELHFELGKLRRRHKQFNPMRQNDYTIALTETDDFTQQVARIQDDHPEYGLEMGLLFVADSLSKLRPEHHLYVATDQEISDAQPGVRDLLRTEGKNEALEHAILQLPVNVAAAHTYIRVWNERRQSAA